MRRPGPRLSPVCYTHGEAKSTAQDRVTVRSGQGKWKRRGIPSRDAGGQDTLMDRIASFAYGKSRLIIVVVALINLAALASFTRFDMDTDFLNFFTSGNPRAQEYERLNEEYQAGETVVVLIEQDDSLLNEQHLEDILQLQEYIEGLAGISRVQSFIPDEILVEGIVFDVDRKFIAHHADILEDFIRDNVLTRQLLSADESIGSLVVTLEADAPAAEVLESLEQIAETHGTLNLFLAGNEVIKSTIWDYLLRILLILPPCAIILVLLIFSAVLKHRRLAVLAMIPAGLGALWTVGTILWSGEEFNLLTVLSPVFVVVIGAADGLHYVSHLLDNLPRCSDRRQLTVETMRLVGMPMFLTTITTMAGFASLTWSEVAPMRQMGIFISLGVGYAGLLSLSFLPAVLSRAKLPEAPRQARSDGPARLVLEISRHRAAVVLAFAAIVVVSALQIPRLQVVSNQLMFFKQDSEITRIFDKVEEHFGGALPLTGDIAASRGLLTLRDYRYAEDILDAERELERLPGIGSAVSLFDIVASLAGSASAGEGYPENPAVVDSILRQMDDEDLETWYSDDGLRMVIRTEDLGAVDIDLLDSFVARHPGIRGITGMPVLFDEMNKLVVRSQVRSLGLAFVLIFLMLLFTIRRLRAALVALIPIAITVVAIMGMLGISKFELNTVTAIMSAISIGVGVDYSIHLVSGIYYFRERGHRGGESVDLALRTVARPVLANAFGLAIGLSVLFLSPLRIHLQVAAVMWVAMVVSSLGALLLVPYFYRGGEGASSQAAS